MAISNISILSMLRTRMHWHQERQRLLSENVSNADTPNFQPRELKPPKFDRPVQSPVALARTSATHLTALGSGDPRFGTDREGGYETRPAGNAVSLEEEMIKVAANQMEYQAASTLYAKSLGLVKTALGKR
jgi:flagellar basal-body rod protein FlgB